MMVKRSCCECEVWLAVVGKISTGYINCFVF
ncbi:hypothetical protein E2C01_028309 [Portunus trituberculatus]|uniref:Uncharacterized protein n=1 Tax=Portunus trituberculatus TaxID=210409 RepID=A0A5B7ENT7_PORTR|nr:hypothetical protein [Portunus trituberculatus]